VAGEPGVSRGGDALRKRRAAALKHGHVVQVAQEGDRFVVGGGLLLLDQGGDLLPRLRLALCDLFEMRPAGALRFLVLAALAAFAMPFGRGQEFGQVRRGAAAGSCGRPASARNRRRSAWRACGSPSAMRTRKAWRSSSGSTATLPGTWAGDLTFLELLYRIRCTCRLNTWHSIR
jgi:hypothetical protein